MLKFRTIDFRGNQPWLPTSKSTIIRCKGLRSYKTEESTLKGYDREYITRLLIYMSKQSKERAKFHKGTIVKENMQNDQRNLTIMCVCNQVYGCIIPNQVIQNKNVRLYHYDHIYIAIKHTILGYDHKAYDSYGYKSKPFQSMSQEQTLTIVTLRSYRNRQL